MMTFWEDLVEDMRVLQNSSTEFHAENVKATAMQSILGIQTTTSCVLHQR
jgi:hypothetical protein